MKQPYTKPEYSKYVEKKSPNSPMGQNIIWAFVIIVAWVFPKTM